MSEQKTTLIQRIYATIAKRDRIKQLLLDGHDEFNPNAVVFMHELQKFCYAAKPSVKVNKITGGIDPIALAVAEGRREVYLRIMELLHFSDDKALQMIQQINNQED